MADDPGGGGVVGVVGVVVVTYNPGDELGRFLASLPVAGSRPVDVVLADNGSVDGAPQAAAGTGASRLVPTGGNLGYGGGANVGVAVTAGEFVLIANPDVILGAGSLDALVDAFVRWPQAGSVGPLIYTPDGQIYPSARALPTLGRGIGHALCGWWWPNNPWTRGYRQEKGRPFEGPVGWLSGSCLLVRRTAFEAVGGFDEGYFMYFEDTDLGRRLGEAGWQNVYVPAASVTHIGGHSTAKDPTRMVREHHRSAYRYLASRRPGPLWAPLRIVLRLGLLARYELARLLPAVAAGARPGRRSTTTTTAPGAGPGARAKEG